MTELITASGLATAGPGGHRLLPGIRLVLPVWVSLEVDVVETATWFGEVMDLRDVSKWQEAALSYEASRLTTSPPAFSHYTMTYHGGSSEAAARRSVKQFVAEAADIRQTLEVAYPHR